MKEVFGDCAFCGLYRRLTHEHIWARWLRQYIPRDMKTYQAGNTIIDEHRTTHTSKKRPGDPHHLKIACVCEACNSGWMSKIQTQVKEHVVPLISGKEIRLTIPIQRLIASWISMAVICAEFRSSDTVSISSQDRTYLFQYKEPPKEWKIWIGRYQSGTWRAKYSHSRVLINDTGVPNAIFEMDAKPNTQTTTYVVGELFVHVLTSI